MNNLRVSATLALLVISVGACAKKPGGQVVAVVNGEEITAPELNAEIGGGDASTAPEAVRKAALERLVDRRLLADAARKDGLDKDPDFLIHRRSVDDALLVQLLAQRIGSKLSIPETQKVDTFIKDRPTIFGQRKTLTLDRIQFTAPQDLSKLKQLEVAHSLDAVAQILQGQNIHFIRGQAVVDSATISPTVLEQMDRLPAGEPFIIRQGSAMVAAVITGAKANPLEGDTAKPVAANLLRNEQLDQAVQQRLKAAKAEAKIEYGKGFAPNDKPPAAK